MSPLFLIVFVLLTVVCSTSVSQLLSSPSSLSGVKDIVEIIEKLTTLAAIIVGGLWTYWIFIKNRQRFPRAEVINKVHKLATSGKLNILRVDLVVRNIGNVLMQIDEIGIVISQIEPIPKVVVSQLQKTKDILPDGQTEYSWDEIAGRSEKYNYLENEIEPGESQAYQFDFRIDISIKKVEIYSSVHNISKSSKYLAWDCATIVDL